MTPLAIPRAVAGTTDGIRIHGSYVLVLNEETLEVLAKILTGHDARLLDWEAEGVPRKRWDPTFAIWFAVAKLQDAAGHPELLGRLVEELGGAPNGK